MAHNEIEGNVIGEVWREQETAKEISYFLVKGEENWFSIEYTGELMLERANYMADRTAPGIHDWVSGSLFEDF